MTKLDRNAVFERFYALVDSIPRGQVATYGQIAAEAGLPRHSRHVGRALKLLPKGSTLPWFRVLNARGEISPRPGRGEREQRRRLTAEGIEVSAAGRVNLARFQWEGLS